MFAVYADFMLFCILTQRRPTKSADFEAAVYANFVLFCILIQTRTTKVADISKTKRDIKKPSTPF